MAKINLLSALQVKSAKPRDKDYVLSDGGGLQLRVRANGSTLWNFNYRHPITKKRVNMGLGAYPNLSLGDARKKASSARSDLEHAIDPKAKRDQALQQAQFENEHTFKKVADEWLQLKAHDVTPNYLEDISRSLDLHIHPKLGDIPVHQITAPQAIRILKPIEAKGHLETIKRLTQRLNEVMIYALNAGLISVNPLADIRANFRKPVKEHMPSLKPEELPSLMIAVANASIKRVTRFLLEWQLHTMTRPAEAAGTRWDEINIENRVWIIPAQRMKRRREHAIPLSDHAIALLEAIEPISGRREHVFPADRNPRTHCNSQTVNMAIKRMGFEGRLVSHGLRSIASTTLNEQGFDRELIEVALAHTDNNQVRAAYNRADYLERRRPMMEWWSGHIETASKGSLSVTGFKGFKVVG